MFKYNSILFVCWGNVCRSPAAELMLKRELKRAGMGHLEIASAGVGADTDCRKPSFGMWWAALRRGLWLKPKPRLFRKSDCSKFDLIVAMDRDTEFGIRTISSQDPSNVKLLSHFLPDGALLDVPDPQNGSAAVCNLALEMLERACRMICLQIMRESSYRVGAPLRQNQRRSHWLENSSSVYQA